MRTYLFSLSSVWWAKNLYMSEIITILVPFFTWKWFLWIHFFIFISFRNSPFFISDQVMCLTRGRVMCSVNPWMWPVLQTIKLLPDLTAIHYSLVRCCLLQNHLCQLVSLMSCFNTFSQSKFNFNSFFFSRPINQKEQSKIHIASAFSKRYITMLCRLPLRKERRH